MVPDDKYSDITGVILAGGRSSRMGRDKATLKVDGVPLFRRVLGVLQELFSRVLIAGDRKDLCEAGIESYADPYPGSALGGIYTGLFYSKTPYIFVAPCDMPYPDPSLIRLITSHRKGFDVVIPKTPAGFEPCFALYGRSCMEPSRHTLERGLYRINALFSCLRVFYLEVEDLIPQWQRSLKNINTPEDYRLVQEKNE